MSNTGHTKTKRPHVLFVDDQGKNGRKHFDRVCPDLSAVKCMKARSFRYDQLGYKSVTKNKAQFRKYASRLSNKPLRRIVTTLGALNNGDWEMDHSSGVSVTQMRKIEVWPGTLVVFDLDGTLTQMDYLWGRTYREAIKGFATLGGGKITPYDLATFYLGGNVRTRHLKHMFDVLKQRGVTVKILTKNAHPRLAEYVKDMFKAIGVDIDSKNVIKAGDKKSEDIKDILLA